MASPDERTRDWDPKLPAGVIPIGAADSEQLLTLSVYVRPPRTGGEPLRADEELRRAVEGMGEAVKQLGETKPLNRQPGKGASIIGHLEADPEAMARVEKFLRDRLGFEIVAASTAACSVRVKGTPAMIEKAFGVWPEFYTYEGRGFYGHGEPIVIAVELKDDVSAVFGLDSRPISTHQARTLHHGGHHHLLSCPPRDTYYPTQIARMYGFPRKSNGEELRGKGVCIGILALRERNVEKGIYANGGYSESALTTYFERVYKDVPLPAIEPVLVLGPGNVPGQDTVEAALERRDSTLEVMLDIQVAGAIAPEATLAIYFSENSAQGWVDALYKAINDQLNHPSVISISYSGAESDYAFGFPEAARVEIERALQLAAAKGITVCCASGDQGQDRPDFPAASPYVLAVGGTRLEAKKNANGTYKRGEETPWNDPHQGLTTGGGISKVFTAASWQAVEVARYIAAADNLSVGGKDLTIGIDTLTGSTPAAKATSAGVATASDRTEEVRPAAIAAALTVSSPEVAEAFANIAAETGSSAEAGAGSLVVAGEGTPAGGNPKPDARSVRAGIVKTLELVKRFEAKNQLTEGRQIGRGAPDVAAVADLRTGVLVINALGSHLFVAGGTSAAAPLWAGLIARINQVLQQKSKSVGYLTPLLYKARPEERKTFLNDITDGRCASRQATAEWDPCTGLGSPNGEGLLKFLNKT
jgi:kumamolisin